MTEKLSPESPMQHVRQAIRSYLPDLVSEDGVIDIEYLKRVFGDAAGSANERYGLSWSGRAKQQAIVQHPSLGTLRPKAGEGINEETTGNLIIEGDNLEVLKLMQKAYLGKIKMIYIDPPYNTGNDFMYEDNFADPLAGYLEQTGQTVDGKRLSTNTETAGRYHSNWLSMMYPRLTLARNLLREDGVIFISIDDNEVANLRKICDEVFGEENFVTLVPVITNLKGNNDQFGFAGIHEYLLVIGRQRESLVLDGLPLSVEAIEEYSEADQLGPYKIGPGLRMTGENAPRSKQPSLWFPVYVDPETMKVSTARDSEKQVEVWPTDSSGTEMSWRWSKRKFTEESTELLVKVGRAGDYQIYKKLRLERDGVLTTVKPKSVFYRPEYSGTTAAAELTELIGNRIFPYPKSKALVKDILYMGAKSDPSALILDFFAGSGTTAQAVLEMNEEDGGNRKFILVQLPEVVDEDSAAAKAGFANIVEITKERVRRVIKKLDGGTKEGLGLDGTKSLDRGFKVYALDRSNFVPWDATAATDAASLEQQLELAVDNVVHGRSHADLLAEILLKTGFPLDTSITKVTIAGTDVYQVADPGFLVCLAEKVDAALIKAIAATKPHRVVILDAAFQGNDALKTNAVQAFKDQGVEMFRTA